MTVLDAVIIASRGGLSVSGGSRGIDDETLVADAGLIVPATLMVRLGATQAVLPFRVMAPSTLGTFLRSFTFGHIRQHHRPRPHPIAAGAHLSHDHGRRGRTRRPRADITPTASPHRSNAPRHPPKHPTTRHPPVPAAATRAPEANRWTEANPTRRSMSPTASGRSGSASTDLGSRERNAETAADHDPRWRPTGPQVRTATTSQRGSSRPGHPSGHAIFDVLNSLAASSDVVRTRLVNGSVPSRLSIAAVCDQKSRRRR